MNNKSANLNRELLSVVVPCHNEEASLPLLFDAIDSVAQQLTAAHPHICIELVIVDDGSRDKTITATQDCAKKHPSLHAQWISFSRNFGKEAALIAGLEHARGDYVAVIAADLQDPPELLLQMIEPLLAGECDCVAAQRVTRQGEPAIRSFFSNAFYKIINTISDTEFKSGARDFRLMTRRMVNAVLDLPERVRFSKGIFGWVGFETQWIPYENHERSNGSSSWSFAQLVSYSISGIVAFSTAPLALASAMGIILCLLSLIAVIFIVVRAVLFGDPVAGWPSLACIIIFLGGLQLLCLGIVGQYLAKVYEEVKGRPHYVIKDQGSSDITESPL